MTMCLFKIMNEYEIIYLYLLGGSHVQYYEKNE
jgi:hypothetical protein